MGAYFLESHERLVVDEFLPAWAADFDIHDCFIAVNEFDWDWHNFCPT